ncbi:hypothetical protein [Streptomyces fractus]|uniref:hypothetical protein n=1 Tax=Streptomyces fractus TaxID=641806 RepID=UPI003CFA3B2B
MQLIDTPSGDVVAVMEAKEVLVLDVVLARYLAQEPDSFLAARMLQAVSRANEERAEHAERGAARRRACS